METILEYRGDQPAPTLLNGEDIKEERIVDVTRRAGSYLTALYRKANVMKEESHRPILSPEEHAYIGNAIADSAHLIRYWLELPGVQMPPPSEELGFTVEQLKKIGVPVGEKTEDIIKDEEKFREMLGWLASSRKGYTSQRDPQINKTAIICAKELVNLMPLLASSNNHTLPRDYSVDISLHKIAYHPEAPDFKGFPPDVEGLKRLLKGLEPDSSGYIRLDDSRSLELESILKDVGIAMSRPEPNDIKEGIESAKAMASEGKAEGFLKALPFLPYDKVERTERHLNLLLKWPIYINPESIVGTQEFADWSGYGLENKRKADDLGDKKPSIDVIIDYATRGTPLPASPIKFMVQEAEIVIYGENSHTTAAARLRLEPLPVNLIHLYV